MTVVLKLGGSVITDKAKNETLDDDSLDRAVKAIAASAPDDLVLVHGGGSFGHPMAAAHGLTTTNGTNDAEAVSEVHGAMQRLNAAVLERLHDRGVPALPVNPLSSAVREADSSLDLFTHSIEAMLSEEFVPVLHGDVIAHHEQGATVLSGDELVAALAETLTATRVGLCTSAKGVIDETGGVMSAIEDFGSVEAVLGDSNATDVTGGMAGKVRTLLGIAAPAWVFDIDGLDDFLAGGSPGTKIE